MATLYIGEYADALMLIGSRPIAAPQEPPVAEQTLAIGAGSVASAAFNVKTKFVRLHADAICSVAFDTAPTATAANHRLAQNQTELVGVPLGQNYKVAVIVNT
jgi:hypothetical protein